MKNNNRDFIVNNLKDAIKNREVFGMEDVPVNLPTDIAREIVRLLCVLPIPSPVRYHCPQEESFYGDILMQPHPDGDYVEFHDMKEALLRLGVEISDVDIS